MRLMIVTSVSSLMSMSSLMSVPGWTSPIRQTSLRAA
jgi:hypothetical protein